MSSPVLTMLATAPEEKAFAAVIAVLKTDPHLQTAGVTWQTWDGDAGDLAVPTLKQMPYVSLTPMPGQSGWAEESQHRSNLIVSVRLFVAGTHRADMLNLWGAIRTALFPQDATRRTYVEGILSALMVNGELTAQPFTVQPVDDSAKMLTAAGSLTIKMFVNT